MQNLFFTRISWCEFEISIKNVSLVSNGVLKFITKFNPEIHWSNSFFPKNIIRLPWNQETLLGYFGETCYFVVVSLSYLIINGTFMLLFISLCLHNGAFYEMFHHFIRKWEESDENRNDVEFLHKLIEFHVSTKKWDQTNWMRRQVIFNANNLVYIEFSSVCRWFFMCTEVYRQYVMIQLLCSAIMLACAFFQLDLVRTS